MTISLECKCGNHIVTSTVYDEVICSKCKKSIMINHPVKTIEGINYDRKTNTPTELLGVFGEAVQ